MSEILDSGERREFESGAVRDMSEGKGRYDLLPMCVLMRLAKHYEKGAIKYKERNWEKGIPAHSFADSAMRHLVKYLDGWTDEDHLISAIWNLCGLAWGAARLLAGQLVGHPVGHAPVGVVADRVALVCDNLLWTLRLQHGNLQQVGTRIGRSTGTGGWLRPGRFTFLGKQISQKAASHENGQEHNCHSGLLFLRHIDNVFYE